MTYTQRFQCAAAAGAILGDLPPYEAFPIGGTNSVRGYSEGGVGSGRNYVAGTAEMHLPLFKPVEVRESHAMVLRHRVTGLISIKRNGLYCPGW